MKREAGVAAWAVVQSKARPNPAIKVSRMVYSPEGGWTLTRPAPACQVREVVRARMPR